jgi:CRP-like cAMP-binding protein
VPNPVTTGAQLGAERHVYRVGRHPTMDAQGEPVMTMPTGSLFVTHDVSQMLGSAWLTRDLKPEVIRSLAAIGRVVNVGASELVLEEGDPTDSMAIVIEGRIALRLRVPERGNVTILTVEPGDVVGWSALVPPYRATSTAVALDRGLLVSFEGEELRRLLAADRSLALEVYPLVLRAVARRLEATRLQLLDMFSSQLYEPW